MPGTRRFQRLQRGRVWGDERGAGPPSRRAADHPDAVRAEDAGVEDPWPAVRAATERHLGAMSLGRTPRGKQLAREGDLPPAEQRFG